MNGRAGPFSVPTLAALVVGNMIGAGVFTTSGFALADLGSPAWVLAAWVVGGVIALTGAASYGALNRVAPASGGEYLYLSRNVHPAVGFVAGWVSLLAGFVGAIAYAAITFAAYAAPGLGGDSGPRLVATAVIVVATALHAIRLEAGVLGQNAVVALKLALIGGFCVYAVAFGGAGDWPGVAALERAPPAIPVATFALTLVWVSFSYSGFNAAVYIAGEVPEGARRVPRALLLGTFVTLLIYLALNAIFVLAPPFDAIAGQEDVAAIAAAAVGGDGLGLAVRAVIVLALFTSVSAMTMVGPRVYAKMADDGLMPRALALRGETPAASILMQSALAIVVVWISGLRELLSYLSFTLSLGTAATVASLFVVVGRRRDLAARLPGYPWAPAIFVAATLTLGVLAATQSPAEMIAALATIASGLLFYWAIRRFRMRQDR